VTGCWGGENDRTVAIIGDTCVSPAYKDLGSVPVASVHQYLCGRVPWEGVQRPAEPTCAPVTPCYMEVCGGVMHVLLAC
jgi:hypothetical protein